MNIFRADGKVYNFLCKFSNIAILNFWWVLCSMPVVTFGAATTAMYASAYKLAKGEESTVTRDFFTAFRENWKQSTLIWLILAVTGAVLGIDCWFWYELAQVNGRTAMNTAMLVAAICLLVVWALELLYVFAMQAYYDNTLKNTMRNSLLFAYRNPAATGMLLVLAASGVILNCTILFVNLFFVVYGLGWFGYMAARLHLGTFEQHRLRHEALAKKSEEKQNVPQS